MTNGPQFDSPVTSIPHLMRTHWLLITLLFATLWIRVPLLTAGLPYFTQEDEAHHFNRTMDMVKSGDLNPHYFHKPSLHFYLRLPFVAGAALRERRSGAINSVKEIKTRDQYGVGGYAFSSSHPSTVKSARLCSLLLSLATIIGAYWLTLSLSGCRWGSIIAAGVAAFAPEASRYSATIGVDVVMTFFAIGTSLTAVLVSRKYSLSGLLLCSVLAGLAVSSKYNALPIFLVPITLWFLSGSWRVSEVLTAFLGPWLAFILTSPFIVTSLPMFIDHLGYELWHYGVAGHEGHTAEAGMAQFLFYGKWLLTDGGGLLALVSSILGILYLIRRHSKADILTLIFPLCFLFLMVGQRANFTRNMVALIPFLGVLAGCGTHFLLAQLRIGGKFPRIVPVFAIILLAQPFLLTLQEKRVVQEAPESRKALFSWLLEHAAPSVEFGISGQLQVASDIRSLPGVSLVNEVGLSARELILNGITYVVMSGQFSPPPGEKETWSKIHSIPGLTGRQRIIENPEIAIYKLTPSAPYLTQLGASVAASPTLRLPVTLLRTNKGDLILRAQCDGEDIGEDYCWIKARYSLLILSLADQVRLNPQSKSLVTVKVPLLSPWRPQEVTLTTQGATATCSFSNSPPNEWNHCSFSLPESVLASKAPLLLTIASISSPASRGINGDPRRLGVAFVRK